MKKDNKPKEQFKDRLIEWAEKRLSTSFSNLNPVQQSRQMIYFYVDQILQTLNPGLVPDDEGELESCIVDGPKDGGADFIYRSDEGLVLLVQAKYRGKDASEDPAQIGRFCDFPHRLYLASQGTDQALSPELLEIGSQIDWDNDSFRLHFITTGKTGDAARSRVDQGISPIPGVADFLDRSAFYYSDAIGLNSELREALSAGDFASKPIEFPCCRTRMTFRGASTNRKIAIYL